MNDLGTLTIMNENNVITNAPMGIYFRRVWAMPNKYTFKIKVVMDFLMCEVGCEGWDGWIDPMCGTDSPAQIGNDIDPTITADMHLDALSFLKQNASNEYAGVLFDPPYSAAMAGGKYANPPAWIKYVNACKDEIARVIKSGGKAICFGWSSNGLGMKRGFRLTNGLLIAHGGSHQHDTIITVEVKQ